MSDAARERHAIAIQSQRTASNQAIAARDADRVTACMMSDVTVSVARGPMLKGREASRKAFAEQFADRAFLGYVRTAEEIAVQEPPVRATERGRWVGRWRSGIGEQVIRGSYMAEWCFTDLGWLIQSEHFEQREP